MKRWSRPVIFVVAAAALVWAIAIGLAASGPQAGRSLQVASPQSPVPSFGRQSQSGQKPPMSEEVFKNVTALKGIPVDEFMGTMGLFSAALSMCCGECHDTEKWEVETPRKRTARRMVEMVNAINKTHFNGRQVVTCWTCHRGRDRPVVTPTIDTLYGDPQLQMDDILPAVPGMPSADQIFDKYIQALGGAQRLASLTSYVAKGTSQGYVTRGQPTDIYAKAPDQRATYIHTDDGDMVRTFNGRTGSILVPLTAVKEYDFSGSELEGARLDARMAFPGRIKEFLTNWRVNNPTTINDRQVNVIQGNGANGLVATFYFDRESGLLVRMVRYSTSAMGRVPTQIDYSDYRPVAGVMMPFRWTFAWTSGRDNFVLTEIQPNIPIDAAKFAKPVARR